MVVTQLKNGKFRGEYKIFWDNGQLLQIIYFNNGVAFGLNIGYWKDGKIWFKDHLKDNEFHGLCELYDERGALVERVNCIDGCIVN